MVLWKSTPAQCPPNLNLPRKQNLFSQMQEEGMALAEKNHQKDELFTAVLDHGITTTSFRFTVKIDLFTPRLSTQGPSTCAEQINCRNAHSNSKIHSFHDALYYQEIPAGDELIPKNRIARHQIAIFKQR